MQAHNSMQVDPPVAHKEPMFRSRPVVSIPKGLPATGSLRFQMMSDLHVEFPRAVERLPKWTANAPYLFLLGDIGYAGKKNLQDFLLSQAALNFERIFYIAGNHEYYGGNYDKGMKALEDFAKTHPKLTFLQKSSFLLEGVRILATTLWSLAPTDAAKKAVSLKLNDYRVITIGESPKPNLAPRRLTVDDTNAFHKDEAGWLRAEVDAAAARGERVVIMTHHAPSIYNTSHPRFDGDDANAAFATDMEDLMRPPVVAWCYGHTHYNCGEGQMIGTTQVLSNQAGYNDSERSYFDPNRVYRF